MWAAGVEASPLGAILRHPFRTLLALLARAGLTASGGAIASSGTFRPNRLPSEPIKGSSRSL